MAKTNVARTDSTGIDTRIGHVYEDQRNGDLRQVIYVDSRVVLLRDEMGYTTLIPRRSFESDLGLRFRARSDVDPDIDGGQYGNLRDRLAEYEKQDGRKAAHKVEALEEALDLLAGLTEGAGADDATGDDSPVDGDDEEVPFEEIPGIGPETAGKLRARGFVTQDDVRTAGDAALLAVPGVGATNLSNIREFVG